MTSTIAPNRGAGGGAKALAVVLTLVNLAAVLMLAVGIMAFLIGYDGEDLVTPRITVGLTLAVVGLLLACTIGGWRGLGRRPGRALLVMGGPGLLVAFVTIVSLVLAYSSVSKIDNEMIRSGWPPRGAPMP